LLAAVVGVVGTVVGVAIGGIAEYVRDRRSDSRKRYEQDLSERRTAYSSLLVGATNLSQSLMVLRLALREGGADRVQECRLDCQEARLGLDLAFGTVRLVGSREIQASAQALCDAYGPLTNLGADEGQWNELLSELDRNLNAFIGASRSEVSGEDRTSSVEQLPSVGSAIA
jgi:hypothetical protein